MQEGTLLFAFVAGLVSFLAPCVLPLIPGFLSYLAGVSITDANATNNHRKIFINSIFFVLGFSTVFAALGVLLNTLFEQIAYDVQTWLSRIGGALIIFFGLYLVGLIKIGFLQKEHKLKITKRFSSAYLTSFVFGAAFAAGWTPCVGAVLGGILALAATQPGSAFSLLMAYSLGLGLPFLVVGFFAGRITPLLVKYSKAARYINIAFGALLILLGILIFTENLSRIANFELLNRLLLK
jgi:cytochrome c-type biogenesis protein